MESPPRNVLADTGPLFSLLHVGDADHARAVQFSRAFTGLLITTWPVITEVCYLLGQYNRRGIGGATFPAIAHVRGKPLRITFRRGPSYGPEWANRGTTPVMFWHLRSLGRAAE